MILNYIDCYKIDHRRQYPDGTTLVFSNWTARKSMFKDTDKVTFVGLQYFIKKYLIEEFDEFFQLDIDKVCKQYEEKVCRVLGIESFDVSHIRALHELQYLPVEIRALPEGSSIKIGQPSLAIYNTHPDFFWLVNYLETIMSTTLWLPSTSATKARQYRENFEKYCDLTNFNDFLIPYQGHDFSFRGMGGLESACLSGIGHLVYFDGTDTYPAMDLISKYYGGQHYGASVPATEHSVLCSHGKDNELGTFRHLLNLYPKGIVSVVSDTWDLWQVVDEFLPKLKEEILARDGKLVIRPDCYDEETEILTDSGWKLFKDLDEKDLVAQVLEDGSREFVKPLKITSQHYEGDMLHFQDRHGKVDLLVTPNHRMILLQDGEERIVEASKLGKCGNAHQKMIRSASAPSNPRKHLSDLDRLRIAFQADGSFQTKCKPSKIRFSFSKQRKIDRLKYILNCLNLEYEIYPLSDGKFEFSITLDTEDFKKDFEWVKEKELTKEWCIEFIEECSYWDSCRRSDHRFKFDTTSVSVSNKVEFIALSAGYGVLRSFYHDNRKDIFSDVFTLHILKDNLVGGQSWTNNKVNYSGKIYCVTVPTGKLFVRRNKCTMICGNSGDPADIICGDAWRVQGFTEGVLNKVGENGVVLNYKDNKYYKVKLDSDHEVIGEETTDVTSANKGLIELLWDIFGGTVNAKGFKELNSHIGVIYGDSITLERQVDILERLKAKGFASSNIVLGLGSYTYQYTTRDVYGHAMKATYCEVEGEARNIFKDPMTDNGTKKSAKGLLAIFNGELKQECSWEDINSDKNQMLKVFSNSELLIDYTFQEVRNNAVIS